MSRFILPLAALSLASVSFAQSFDFESLTPSYTGAGSRPGAYTSVSQTVSGLTMSVTRTQGTAFDVYGLTTADVIVGKRFLDGFNVGPERPFIMDFSSDLSEFSMFIGQFTASQSRTAILRAYSGPGGTGALVSESIGTIPMFLSGTSSNMTGVNLTVSGASFRSVTATANTPFNNAFIDNGFATVAVVPEPVTIAFLLPAALLLRRRKQSK